jgi:hypothetical protein
MLQAQGRKATRGQMLVHGVDGGIGHEKSPEAWAMAVMKKTADQLEAQFVILSVRQTVYNLLGSRMRENPGVRMGSVFGLRTRRGCAAHQACSLVDLAGGFGERVWSRPCLHYELEARFRKRLNPEACYTSRGSSYPTAGVSDEILTALL